MSSIMREDWIECKLEDIVISFKRGPFGGDLKKSFFIQKGYAVYEQQHAINNDFSRIRYFIDEERFEKLEACEVKSGDYIVSCSGTMGKIARLPENSPIGIINQALLKICLNDKIMTHEYFVNYFRSKIFQTLILGDSRGSGIQNISGIKEIKIIPVFLPPLPIQRAIVSKIEALFSDLDNGIANFKKAQEQLKIYRQAVLKKAFEGGFSITNDENQSSDNLLKGWKWVKVSDVCDMKAGYFIKADEINSEFENGLFPCYGGNGLRGYVKSTTHEGLFPIVGRQGALCGNVHLVNGKFHATEHAVVVSAKKEIDIKCLYYKLTEMKINQYATGTAQPGLSVNKILPIEIIYPKSLQEQTQIVQEIESRLSVTDNLEFVIRNSIEKAEALRQSILKKAFEGKLLSQAEIELCKQAADYEPASELLKKITNEKLRITNEKQKKKPRNS